MTRLPPAEDTNEPQISEGSRRTEPVLVLEVPVASSVTAVPGVQTVQIPARRNVLAD